MFWRNLLSLFSGKKRISQSTRHFVPEDLNFHCCEELMSFVSVILKLSVKYRNSSVFNSVQLWTKICEDGTLTSWWNP